MIGLNNNNTNTNNSSGGSSLNIQNVFNQQLELQQYQE